MQPWVEVPLCKRALAKIWNHLGLDHPGVLDVRGRSDFSRFDPRPERPHFSNFGPPAERRPFFVERRPFCETLPAVGL